MSATAGMSAESRAVAALEASLDRVTGWCRRVRPENGTRGRFRWAVQSTREANIASTAYIMGGLRKMGIFDRVIGPDDRREGAAWIRSLHVGNEQYRDPALLDRPTPGWPSDKPWPDPAMLGGINQYARTVLRNCMGTDEDLPPDEPPPGWPQAGDDPATMVEWVKTRPWNRNAWGAGSHSMRMATYMLHWHVEGRLPLDPVLEVLNFFYRIQDPATGLWGTPDQPRHVRINGAFKLFPLMREQLDLPLPHADKLIDQVLLEFARPDYDATVGACDEWDNWYVIALALDPAGGHRLDDIRRLALDRIVRVLELFAKPDGGLSYHPAHCQTNWIGYDMAEPLPQGDAMGPGILAAGINVCIDLAGLKGRTAWTGEWRMRPQREPDSLRNRILAGLHT